MTEEKEVNLCVPCLTDVHFMSACINDIDNICLIFMDLLEAKKIGSKKVNVTKYCSRRKTQIWDLTNEINDYNKLNKIARNNVFLNKFLLTKKNLVSVTPDWITNSTLCFFIFLIL